MESEDTARLHDLMQAWLEARTSPAEEAELRRGMSEKDVPPDLEWAKRFFAGLAVAGKLVCPGPAPALKPRRLLRARCAAAAAAVVAVCAGIGLASYVSHSRQARCYLNGRLTADYGEAAAKARTALASFGREASRSMESTRVLTEAGRSLEFCGSTLRRIPSSDDTRKN